MMMMMKGMKGRRMASMAVMMAIQQGWGNSMHQLLRLLFSPLMQGMSRRCPLHSIAGAGEGSRWQALGMPLRHLKLSRGGPQQQSLAVKQGRGRGGNSQLQQRHSKGRHQLLGVMVLPNLAPREGAGQ
jgi:hypothetical protein